MLETLESAAESAARRATGAMAQRDRASLRNERFGSAHTTVASASSALASANGPDRDLDIPPWRSAAPRPTRAFPLFSSADSAGGGSATAPEEAGSFAAAMIAAFGGGGSGRVRFNRPLHDMLPAAMMALPFGFHRIMGGRSDADDNAGVLCIVLKFIYRIVVSIVVICAPLAG